MRKELTKEELEEVFEVRDGELWRKIENTNQYGKKGEWVKVENNPNDKGYKIVRFRQKSIPYQNIIWMLNGQEIPCGYFLDHVNGDRVGNVLNNLRIADKRINGQNLKIHREGKTCGVNKKNEVIIKINGKAVYLGRYKTKEEAEKIYKLAVEKNNKHDGNVHSFKELIGAKQLTSEHKGLSYNAKEKKWKVRLNKMHLGYFKTEEQARQARKLAEEIIIKEPNIDKNKLVSKLNNTSRCA